MSKRKGLGKGLGDMGVAELLTSFDSTQLVSELDESSSALQEVSVSRLKPGQYQPRRKMDPQALEELANSIRSQGIIQPIVVRKDGNDFEIIAGERRWRAAQQAGLTDVPVVVRELSDQSVLAIALIENIQRQDLNVMEEAIALDRLQKEFKMTHQDVAQAVGRSRAAVTNIMRLLKLEPPVRLLVENGRLDMGHARALLSLKGNKQIAVANHVEKNSLSVRQTEQLIQTHLHPSPRGSKETTQSKRDSNILSLERRLSDQLGADVKINQKTKQKGQLIICYHSLDELDGILQHIS